MTPQEQQLVADLFDRLAALENQHRDPDAERQISDGLRRVPNAVYALVQSVLVQDEALKRANACIEELEHASGGSAAGSSSGGFLDSMRNATGQTPARGSVPSVRPGGQGTSGVWGPGPQGGSPSDPSQGYGQSAYPSQGYGQPGYPPSPGAGGMMGTSAPGFGGGSFLGTAAATAAGMVGGGLLLNGIRNMMGGHQALGNFPAMSAPHGGSPWDNANTAAGSDLARDAGAGEIGGSRAAAYQDPGQDNFNNAGGDDSSGQDEYEEAGDFDDGGYDDGGGSDDV